MCVCVCMSGAGGRFSGKETGMGGRNDVNLICQATSPVSFVSHQGLLIQRVTQKLQQQNSQR